ncbi:MAG TPA: GNAT family N-acetyltransferase [Burkholderiales bacterium]|nr:GNAT family N-acetyltransferase [Burkholderiales bacterium]
MATIRVLTEDDVPGVAALVRRVYPDYRWTSAGACESYVREPLFDNPWCDFQLPSWVAEENGRICGFYGVIPRWMELRGRPLRTAVACHYMVDPDCRNALTAMQLAKACLTGPQDLTIADGASDLSRRLWTGIGGTVPLLYSLHWTRPLRPARYALSLLEKRSVIPRAFTLAAHPLGALADAVAARLRPNHFYHQNGALAEGPLDAATMLAHLPEVLHDNVLLPVYNERVLARLLDRTARKTRHGTLRARAVHDGERVIGWYLYYVQPGGVSEVLQLAAREGDYDRVLQRLLADAWQQGAAAVHGRLDPRFASVLSDRHCWLRTDGAWTLVHSRHADVLDAFQRGGAFLSRLDGEWWLEFFRD